MKKYDPQAQETTDTHLDRKTLARRWRCSHEKLKRLEKSGELPHLRIGRVILYRVADILTVEKQAEVAR